MEKMLSDRDDGTHDEPACENRHKYEYAVDPSSQTAPARVTRMVGVGQNVLEIGSGPGSITRILSQSNHCHVTALEVDPAALEKVAPFCAKTMQADLNDPQWPELLKGEQFDRVVAADVLEHLYDPLSVLKAMKPLINGQGSIIVSLPHVSHTALVACLLGENFEYRDWGLLDRTHIRFFGIKNIQALFEQAGLKIVEAEFVICPPEATEFAGHWHGLSEKMRQALLDYPFGRVYQVVVRAVPADRAGTALFLPEMSVPPLEIPVQPDIPKPLVASRFLRKAARRLLGERLCRAVQERAGQWGVRI